MFSLCSQILLFHFSIIFVILINSFLLTSIQAVHIDSVLDVHLVSQGQEFHLISDTW